MIAVIYGNHDHFPDHLVFQVRTDLAKLFRQPGIEAIPLGESELKLGCVETHNDAGECAALFLKYTDAIGNHLGWGYHFIARKQVNGDNRDDASVFSVCCN